MRIRIGEIVENEIVENEQEHEIVENLHEIVENDEGSEIVKLPCR